MDEDHNHGTQTRHAKQSLKVEYKYSFDSKAKQEHYNKISFLIIIYFLSEQYIWQSKQRT